MELSKKRFLFFILPLFFICACGEQPTDQTRRPTSVITPAKPAKDTLPTGGQAKDTVLGKDFAALKVFFRKDAGRKPDSSQELPLSILSNYIKGANFDTTHYISTVNPVDVFSNKYGSFLLIKANCSSGGYCANYYLLSFDTHGGYAAVKDLGYETGDEGEYAQFTYTLKSDTVLVTHMTQYNGETDKRIGVVTKSVKLTIR